MFFIQQNGFTNKTKLKTEFESMEVNEMNKYLSFMFRWQEKTAVFIRKLVCCRFKRLSTTI